MKQFLLILACVLTISFKVQASDKLILSGPDGDHIYLTYQNNEKWVLDHFFIKKGKLQEKISSKSFTTYHEVNNSLLNILSRKSFYKKSNTLSKNLVSTESSQVIWEVKNSWDLSWEEKYITWLEENFDEKFFIKYNISTDCADAAYALRWIFARMNHLPAVTTLAGSHIHFSHESMKKEWEVLSTSTNWYEDQRFLKALDYVLANAYTKTLVIDTYPIEISKQAFRVGTINLTGGHTMIISEIDYQNNLSAPIWKLSSTMPSEVRALYKEMMADNENVSMEAGGFLRMRWPSYQNGKWELTPKKQMPYYSEEQFDPNFKGDEASFSLAVFKKLGLNFDPEKILNQTVIDLKMSLKQRVEIVEAGYEFCLKNDCTEGTQNYEDHSTPSRDKRIYARFVSAHDLMMNISQISPDLETKWKEALENEIFSAEGVTRNLKEWEDKFYYHHVSSHPSDTLSERWGVTNTDIKSSLQKNITRKLTLRMNITQDESCHNDPSTCPFLSEKWKASETYDFDSDLFKSFKGYLNLCKLDSSLCAGKAIPDSLKRLPFMVSNPVASLVERMGQQIDLNRVTFLPIANMVEYLGNDHYFLDKKLYLSKENKFLYENKNVFFDFESKNVFVLDGNKLVVYNIETQLEKVIDLPQDMNEGVWLQKISKDHYFVNDCTDSILTCTGIVLNVLADHVEVSQKFLNMRIPDLSSLIMDRESKSRILENEVIGFHSNTNASFVLFEDKKLEVTSVPSKALLHGEYLYLALETKLEVYNAKSLKLIFEKDYFANLNLKKTHHEKMVVISYVAMSEDYKLLKVENDLVQELYHFSGWESFTDIRENSTLIELYGDSNTERLLILEDSIFDLSFYASKYYMGRNKDVLAFNDENLVYYKNIYTNEEKTSPVTNFISYCEKNKFRMGVSCLSNDESVARKTQFERSASGNDLYSDFIILDPNDLLKEKMTLLSRKESDTLFFSSQNSATALEGSLIQIENGVFVHIK